MDVYLFRIRRNYTGHAESSIYEYDRVKFGLPLLGMVSLVSSEADLRRVKLDRMKFLFSSGSLVGLFVVTIVTMAVMAMRRG